MTAERWRPVVGYEGLYEVSNLGQVRSLDYVDVRGRLWRGGSRKSRPNVRSGHPQIPLRRHGEKGMAYVHRLVLEAFVGPAPEGMEACHNDGNPTNNALSNLRWASRAENNLDRVRHGTHNNTRKTHCPQGHPYDEANTYVNPARGKNGFRMCRACISARSRRTYLAKKEAAK